ncbi:hypothetical protein KY289_037865 [Solanum tuberosum]|nr:hypothetical protein KY289_037865 [Solanum tuberosum]
MCNADKTVIVVSCHQNSAVISYILIVESPRYLCAIGRTSDACDILKKIAVVNKTQLPPGKLVSSQLIEELHSHGKNKISSVKSGFSSLLGPCFLLCFEEGAIGKRVTSNAAIRCFEAVVVLSVASVLLISVETKARPIGPVHVFLNVALPPTSPSFCSWDPCKRPTTIDAFRHPLFQSCFYIPPSVRTKAAIAKTPHSVEQKYKWSFGLLHNPKPSINFSTVKS